MVDGTCDGRGWGTMGGRKSSDSGRLVIPGRAKEEGVVAGPGPGAPKDWEGVKAVVGVGATGSGICWGVLGSYSDPAGV